VRSALAIASLALVAACATAPESADPASDAPESRSTPTGPVKAVSSYSEALQTWRTAEDVNAWIGAAFQYDMARAMRLSETQRSRSGTLPIARPEEFFANPRGVCVDLSRFAVETLRELEPGAQPTYLMIEFAPVSIAGNTLRLHWLAGFRRDGSTYYFADSKRPGHIAGPYASSSEFIREYARYRGRQIVAFRELASYQRTPRTKAVKQRREALR
jgi:hypothetical protein